MSEERSHTEIKQMIVLRKDLKNKDGHKIRTGKLVSQGAHASSKVFFDRGKIVEENGQKFLKIPLTGDMETWLEEKFTKITLKVDSEVELLEKFKEAQDLFVPCALIQDAGLTEFEEPTYTAVAIGPAHEDVLKKITGALNLF